MLAGDDLRELLRHTGDAGGPGQAPHEREAEQEDRRAERSQEEVLDRALRRIRVGLVVRREQIPGEDHQLQTQEQDEKVRRRRDEHRAGHGEDENGRELGDREVARQQVVGREEDRQHDDRDEQHVEERGERVDRVGAAERGSRRGTDGDRQRRRDRETGQRGADRDRRASRPQQVRDEDRGRGEDGRDQRRDRREVLERHGAPPSAATAAPDLPCPSPRRTHMILPTTPTTTIARMPSVTPIGTSMGAPWPALSSVSRTVPAISWRMRPGWVPNATTRAASGVRVRISIGTRSVRCATRPLKKSDSSPKKMRWNMYR